MRFLKKAAVFLVGLFCALTMVVGQEAQQGDSSLTLVRVGPIDVSGGDHGVLQQAGADLFGHAWNYQGREFYALLRPHHGQQWYVAASANPEPGGVFNISGVRFPQAGDFELLVVLRKPNSLTVGSWIDETQWKNQYFAVSRRVTMTVENPPPGEGDSGAGEAHLALLSVGNVSLRPREINSVPAAGDVIVSARGLPNAKVYLAMHVPYTDLCFVVGPGKKGQLPNTYTFHSVSFEAPGDPQQIHFDLLAFTSSQPVKIGPMSWQSFRLIETVTSLSAQILIEGRQLRSDSLRIPYAAITRVGRHKIETEKPAARPIDVEQGDAVEVEGYERTTEGAMFWILTRAKGSSVWLAQGPMLPRGLASAVTVDGRPAVTWVWPSLQFQSESADEETSFEIMAVLSNAIFPNSRVSSASVSAQTVETISQSIPVSVKGAASPADRRLAIARIGNQEAETENEMTVGNTESVVISRPEVFSEPYKVYVGKHVVGASTWSFVEALPNGNAHFVPALHFNNPHAADGTRYQVLAIATKGPLPAREAEYQDFLPHVLTASELINVRYSSASILGFVTLFRSWFVGDAESGAPVFDSEALRTMLWILVAVFVVLVVIFVILVLLLRSNPPLAGEIADTLQRGHATAKQRFELPEQINPGNFLLGTVLLVLMLYVIRYFYISLYTTIIDTATGLTHKASSELAMWLILITAFAGIFADIGHKQSQKKPAPEESQQENRIYSYIFAGSRFIAVILWILQGAIYALFFKNSTGSNMMFAVGFGVGILISAVETIAFFIITELTLVPAAWLILTIVLAPVFLLSFTFRFIQRVFERKPVEMSEVK